MKTLALLLTLIFGAGFLLAQPGQEVPDRVKKEILRLLEEEKLARDLYLELSSRWGTAVFLFVARSEQRHLEMAKELALQYQVPLPSCVERDERGVFDHPAFQKYYAEALRSGSQSEEAALRIAARTEEMDIRDLDLAIEAGLEPNLENSYRRLRQASENHLVAFVRNLRAREVEYQPLFLPENRYREIVNQRDAHFSHTPNDRSTRQGEQTSPFQDFPSNYLIQTLIYGR